MLGVKCKVPNTELLNAAYAEHLILIPGGDNVLRILPPLTITDAEIAEAVSRLDRAAQAVS